MSASDGTGDLNMIDSMTSGNENDEHVIVEGRDLGQFMFD